MSNSILRHLRKPHGEFSRPILTLAISGLVMLLAIPASAGISVGFLSTPVGEPPGEDMGYTYLHLRPYPAQLEAELLPKTRTIKKRVEKSAAPAPAPAPSSPASASSDGVWARLRACESADGRTSSNGKYHGYYQFLLSSWRAAGGTGHPMDHSLEHQTAIAQKWASMTNPYTQWPTCWPRAVR